MRPAWTPPMIVETKEGAVMSKTVADHAFRAGSLESIRVSETIDTTRAAS